MAEISFGGLATGLPTEDLVKSLMAVERRTIDRLEADKEYETQRLKAYGQFDSRLDDLRAAVGNLNVTSDVRTTSTRLSSEEFISASSNGGGVGSYDIAVAQLAQVQKTVTDGLSSETESILGTGHFAINDVAIEVNDTNNSLQGLMASINTLSEETGVTASIINDGGASENYHLVLTGKDAATSFSVGYSFKDDAGEDIAFSAAHVRTAQQAVAYVDGIPVVSNTNTLSGTIAGVTINLDKVSAQSENIGYLHLYAMGGSDLASFARDFYAQYDKPGLIIDVRRNRGGNIDSVIIEKLLRRAWSFWQFPNGNTSTNMQQAFRGHLVVLADEFTYSDGETFTAGVRALDLGTVIGRQTAGAGVWLSGGNRVVDGGIARVAEFPVFAIDGRWITEGRGISPDIEVRNYPYASFQGEDAQLQAALKYLQDKLTEEPVPPLKALPFGPVEEPAGDIKTSDQGQ